MIPKCGTGTFYLFIFLAFSQIAMFLICFKQELESASHPSVCEHLLRTSKQQVSILESELAASRAEIARLRQHESKRLVPAYDSSKEEDWHGIALRLHAHLQEALEEGHSVVKRYKYLKQKKDSKNQDKLAKFLDEELDRGRESTELETLLTQPYGAGKQLLRIATFNVWNLSPPWEIRREAILDEIMALGPHILALQELRILSDGTNQLDQITAGLAARSKAVTGSLAYSSTFFPTAAFDAPKPGTGAELDPTLEPYATLEGFGLLTVFPVVHVDILQLSEPSKRWRTDLNSRRAAAVLLDLAGADFWAPLRSDGNVRGPLASDEPPRFLQVFLTHLSYDLNQQCLNVAELRAWVASQRLFEAQAAALARRPLTISRNNANATVPQILLGDLNTYIAADWALDPLLRRPAMFPTDPAINPCLGPWRDPAPFAISGKPSSKGGKEAVKAKRVELPPAPSANASLPLWHALQQRVSGHGWNFSGGNRQVGGFPSPYAAGEAPFADAWEALHKAQASGGVGLAGNTITAVEDDNVWNDNLPSRPDRVLVGTHGFPRIVPLAVRTFPKRLRLDAAAPKKKVNSVEPMVAMSDHLGVLVEAAWTRQTVSFDTLLREQTELRVQVMTRLAKEKAEEAKKKREEEAEEAKKKKELQKEAMKKKALDAKMEDRKQ